MALLNDIYCAIYEEKKERDRISELNYAREEGYKKAKKETYTKIARSLLKLGMIEEDIFDSIEGLSEFLTLDELKTIKHG